MARITWRVEGSDLVVPRQLLRGLGLQPGDTVSIAPARRRPPVAVRPAAADRKPWTGVDSPWVRATLAEAAEAECEHEIAWVMWAVDRDKG